jgi:hypothetical protein
MLNVDIRRCKLEIMIFDQYFGHTPHNFDNVDIHRCISTFTGFRSFTVTYTLADSYVLKSSEVSGFAAEMACKRKHSKYSSIISSNYVFKGLAFETLGPWCKEAIDYINVIGNRLIAESGDSKSKKFLFERISLAIQRGNAASIRGTFPDSAILSEIFVL